ncbi:MAG: MarR family transcriptional regulator [Jatrophihabitans sp.]|nr:MAG: MarR family transcriptional regulator [Jatrophihabitans sp.]
MTADDARLARAARSLARASRLLERACGDLNLSQYRVLAAVASGHERASRIADRLAVGKPAISATVESLCRRGLLTRGPVAGDQRAVALALTPGGERALAAAETAIVERIDALARHAPDGEALLDALATLGTALDAMSAARHGTAGEPAS